MIWMLRFVGGVEGQFKMIEKKIAFVIGLFIWYACIYKFNTKPNLDGVPSDHLRGNVGDYGGAVSFYED